MDLSIYDKMALSTFTSLEKQSLYQLLCSVMNVDGERNPKEFAIIGEVNHIMGITVADIEASRKLTEPVMTNCLRNMDTLKKAYVAKFMAQIILADGKVTQMEEMYFNYMHQRLGLPNID